MKNKIKLILYIFLFITFNNSSISDEFKVKSNSIKVTDEGNIINAIGDVEVESNNNLIISSDRSILDKKKSLVISSGNVFLIDNGKIKVYVYHLFYVKVFNLGLGVSSLSPLHSKVYSNRSYFSEHGKTMAYVDQFCGNKF